MALADLLINLVLVLLYSMLGLIGIYIVLRVGSLAILKSLDDIRTQRANRKTI